MFTTPPALTYQVKKCQFSNPSNDHVFGYTATKDPEGAREGGGILWRL